MDQHSHHFSALDRNLLQHQLNLGRSQGQIALALGRSRSTVSRAVRRNAVAASPDSGSFLNYDASFACQAFFKFRDKTTAINQKWQTDFTYLKVIGWG